MTGEQTTMEHRIILVREWDSQTAASGCCGRLGGVHSELGDESTYARNRAEMVKMGEVYRALKTALFDDDVEISVADPRNMVWLVPAVLHDALRRGHLSLREAWAQTRRAVSYNSVVVDGRVLFAGHVPGPQEAVAAVRAELDRDLVVVRGTP